MNPKTAIYVVNEARRVPPLFFKDLVEQTLSDCKQTGQQVIDWAKDSPDEAIMNYELDRWFDEFLAIDIEGLHSCVIFPVLSSASWQIGPGTSQVLIKKSLWAADAKDLNRTVAFEIAVAL